MNAPADREALIEVMTKSQYAHWDKLTEQLKNLIRQQNEITLTAIEASGCHVSPDEPTSDMRWAGSKRKNAYRLIGPPKATPYEIYTAMEAASPYRKDAQ